MAPSIAPSNLERRAALPSRSSAEAQKLELCYAQARENQQSHFDCLEDSLYLSYRRRIPSICKLLGYGSSCTCLANYGFCANDSEMNRLKGVIGLTMFKYKPAEKPNESHESHESTEYTEDELESINAVYKKIVGFQKEKNDVLMTFVFVSLMVKEEDGFGLVDIPVFRIPKPNDPSGTYFVDCTGRVYKSWNDFLCNNVLPAGRVCYPKEGVYSGNSDGQVIVDFGLTPAAKVSAKVLKVTDITTSVAGIAAGVASLFPPVAAAGAVAVAATSVYGIVRGSVQLADRGKHGQKLNDKEAFNHWLSIACCALGIGSSAATNTVKLMAQRGQGTSKLLFKAFDGINAAAVTVNGACVVKDGVEIIQKKDRNALDYMQFAMSLALLLHSFKNIKKSERLYCDTQDQILKGCRKNFTSKNQIKKLNKVISKALASDPNKMVGQAKAIRNLKLNKNLILPPSTNSYFNNATRSTSGSTSDSQPQKLHVILSNMKRAMQEIGPCNSEMLLNILSTVVTRSVWGEKILRILRIVLQCRTNVLQNYEEMTKVAMEFIDFFLDIWQNDDDDDGEENVAEVLCGTVFSEFAATEQVFHFPSDHRSWGDKGILQSEEYLKIAQKILDVPDLQSSVLINYDEGAAHVSCGDVGAVTITSSVKESTIVVEKFDSDSIKHVIKNFPVEFLF